MNEADAPRLRLRPAWVVVLHWWVGSVRRSDLPPSDSSIDPRGCSVFA